ncbi:hypothetical protein ACFXK0_10640 [Nocardia sp. NPDC059177]|uniref:hypothetical protein n=1 Tax=Nocardia sp. NPDC059177 TaxID=3346759 RepID=UPI0036C5C64C
MTVPVALLLAAGCAPDNNENSDVSREVTTMTDQSTDIWQLVNDIASQAPLSTDKINSLFQVQLSGTGRQSTGPATVDGVTVAEVGTVTRPDGEWVFSYFDIAPSPCIGLDELKSHYSDVALTDVPRGHSPEEQYVWTSQQPWGALNFGFRERDYCLVGVSLHTEGDWTNTPIPTN